MVNIFNLIARIFLLFLLVSPICNAQVSRVGVENDHLFDAGSAVTVGDLTSAQIENLFILGKVWGFLKYHHPTVVSGSIQWDFELLRMLPKVLAVGDTSSMNRLIEEWIVGLGPVVPCDSCVKLSVDNLYMRPPINWIYDSSVLDVAVRHQLMGIYTNRPSKREQRYIKQTVLGGPDFSGELEYKFIQYPDAGFQLLALFRLWNVIEYWAPYRDLLEEDWDQVLHDAIPKIATAGSRSAFELEMIAFIAKVGDSHSNLWSSLGARPPHGNCTLPVNLRFVQGQAVVERLYPDEKKAQTFQVGDLVEEIGDTHVHQLVETWLPYYPGSNEGARMRDIARNLGSGACGAVRVRIKRDGFVQTFLADRIARPRSNTMLTHEKPGPTFQLLADDVAYLKLSSIKRSDIPTYLDAASKTKGIIIDIRSYPGDFVPFELGSHFVSTPSVLARFTLGDVANPGAFYWGPTASVEPKQPFYPGKIVILIDEVSQSQAEYTAMALRVAPNVKVIGSRTAGADGNVSRIPLPGGLTTMISGIGVFYPDKRPTQRVGIIPDIEVLPTIDGIRTGRDEVLDAAIAEVQR